MAATRSSRTPDPRRSEINRRNRQSRRGFSPEGREKVCAAIRANRPWEPSTGPRTREGKARAARNGFRGFERPSVRRLRAEIAGVVALINQMVATRRSVLRGCK
jgi:hypothetical protein